MDRGGRRLAFLEGDTSGIKAHSFLGGLIAGDEYLPPDWLPKGQLRKG